MRTYSGWRSERAQPTVNSVIDCSFNSLPYCFLVFVKKRIFFDPTSNKECIWLFKVIWERKQSSHGPNKMSSSGFGNNPHLLCEIMKCNSRHACFTGIGESTLTFSSSKLLRHRRTAALRPSRECMVNDEIILHTHLDTERVIINWRRDWWTPVACATSEDHRQISKRV